MFIELITAIRACVVTFLICSIAYPAVVYGIGNTLFPKQAEGSLIEIDGKVVGSELIAQPFFADKYFQPRPSAAGPNGYAADAASGSNLATTNPALRDRLVIDTARQLVMAEGDGKLKSKLEEFDAKAAQLKEKSDLSEKTDADTAAITELEAAVSALRGEIMELEKSVAKKPVPADLVTTSGSGLDPHISPESARYQAGRVAAARKIEEKVVLDLIGKHIERSGMMIGAPERVNVLLLNLALDKAHP